MNKRKLPKQSIPKLMSDTDLIVDNVIEKKQFFPTIIAVQRYMIQFLLIMIDTASRQKNDYH